MTSSSAAYRSCIKFLIASTLFFFNSPIPAADQTQENMTNQYATAFWNSFNTELSAGNLEVYLRHWDKNAERITPTVHAKGIEEIRATYQKYLDAFSDFQQTELRRIVDGNVVVSELLTNARNKATGKLLSLPNVAIVEFNDQGKVMRARVYLDSCKFNP